MKLKKPITLTIEDAEVAVGIWHFLNNAPMVIRGGYHLKERMEPMAEFIKNMDGDNEPWEQLSKQLRNQCIEPGEFEVSRIKIGNHSVEFTTTGIKVGCTEVSKETILEIAKRFQ